MKADRPHWWPAYVGIGSNLDSPREQVRRAIDELGQISDARLVRASGLYRSAPMGPEEQPDFINAVAVLLARLDAESLLNSLQNIESAHGRQRDGEHWGPRTLDLDLLVYGQLRVESERLVIPHPGIAERNFVLLPLEELAPNLQVPGLASVHQLVAKLANNNARIERLAKQ